MTNVVNSSKNQGLAGAKEGKLNPYDLFRGRIAQYGALAVVSAGLVGCKPPKVKDYKEIGPSETAWVIPLTEGGANGGERFDSVAFLEARKVATKRVEIDKVERKIGRFYWSIEWMDSARLVTVDRQMVSREWSDQVDKGTSKNKEGLNVVTKDSIPLTVGLTITASIEETDASLYLYHHGKKPLSEVIDTNIRSYAQAELSKAYGALDFSEAQKNTPTIYTTLFEKAQKAFKAKGVSIHYLGNADGVRPDDEKIQQAINEKFVAEQQIQTAIQNRRVQEEKNQTDISKAEAAKAAAEIMFKAREAATLQTDMEIRRLNAQAAVEMAKRWDGKLPANILPANSPLLMSLGEASPHK